MCSNRTPPSTQDPHGGSKSTFFDNPPAPLEKIEPVHIRQYLDFRISAKVRANREKALFSAIWNYSRERGLTARENPCRGVKGHKETARDVYIDDHLFNAVWRHAETPLRDALDLAYLTGQRPADVLAFSRADIKDGALHIQQGKTKTRLRIEISGQLAELIQRISGRKVMGLQLVNASDGTPFTKHMLRGAFDLARKAAVTANPELKEQIQNFQFRDLRAKAGTDKDESHGMTAAQEQLGHSDPTMTKTYVRHRRGKLVPPTK